MSIHQLFDAVAVLLAVGGGVLAARWKLYHAIEKTAASLGVGYFFALSLGSVLGSYSLGTANLYFSGEVMVGRSILGALLGATLTVELYKLKRGTRGSTGYMYVIPFCLLVIVGRLGCFYSGLDDQTFGTESTLPWAVDFGDGVLRHPVQLYESAAMLVFLIFVLIALNVLPGLIIYYGYYLCIGFYVIQRFIWEFLKPYGSIIGPLNLFQLACLLLLFYSLFMCQGVRNGYRVT